MKKKIVFFTLPAFGHTKEPALLVSELSKIYDISVVTTEKFASFYKGVHVSFYAIPQSDFYFDKNPLLLIQHLLVLQQRILKDTALQEMVKQADCVIFDVHAPWGRDFALEFDKKTISYSVTYTQNMRTFLPAGMHKLSFRYWLASFRIGKKLFLENWSNAIDLFRQILPKYSKKHIAFIPDFLQPKLMRYDGFLYHSLSFKEQEVSHNKSPYVYVSLGTVYQNAQYLEYIVTSLNNTGLAACVVAGAFAENLKKIAHKNVRIVDFADQEAELQKATLFVTHAGTNSVIESMAYKVPMICLPQAVDQFVFSEQVQKLGLGIYPSVSSYSIEKFAALLQAEVLKEEFYRKKYAALFERYTIEPVSTCVAYVDQYFSEEIK